MINLETKDRTPADLREVSKMLNDYAADLNKMAREMEDANVSTLNLKMNTLAYQVQTVMLERMTKLEATFKVAMQKHEMGLRLGSRKK